MSEMAEESFFSNETSVVWKTVTPSHPFSCPPNVSPVFSLLGEAWVLEMKVEPIIERGKNCFTISLLRQTGNERPITHFSVLTFVQKTGSMNDDSDFQSQGSKREIINDVTTLVRSYIGTSKSAKFPDFRINTKVTVVCVFTDLTTSGIPNEAVKVTTQTDFQRILPVETLHDFKLSSDESKQGAYCVSSNLDSLSRDLSKLLEDEVFPDITLRCGARTIAAHKAVLSARSKVFFTMFQSKMSESETGVVDITDIDVQVLELFLKYAYTGRLFESSPEDLLNLYAAGEKYAVTALMMACSEHLINNLTRENCFSTLLMADAHGNQEFKNAIFNFIMNHVEILEDEKWKIFSRENLALSKEILQLIVKQKCFS